MLLLQPAQEQLQLLWQHWQGCRPVRLQHSLLRRWLSDLRRWLSHQHLPVQRPCYPSRLEVSSIIFFRLCHRSSSRLGTDTTFPTLFTRSKGCFSDSQDKRALSTLISSSDNNYPARCISQCAAAGYSLAGVEYGRECWCSNELVHSRKNPDTGNGITDSECNQPCTGDSTATCGAGGKVFVYSNQS